MWSDGKGSFYVISEAPSHYRNFDHCTHYPHEKKVYDAGGGSPVWSIGDAFCKVKIIDPSATREHVTLDYLCNRRPLSFATPDVYYHAEYDGRYYIILSKLTGQTLSKAWPNMDEAMKQYYVSRVTDICKELAVWQADNISGVDGQHLSDRFLTRFGLPKDYSPQNLLR